MTKTNRASNSTWLTGDPGKASAFRSHLKGLPPVDGASMPKAIVALDAWVKDSDLSNAANAMFQEAIDAGHYDDPLGDGAVTDWDDFVQQLAKAVQFAPMFFVADTVGDPSDPDYDKAAGLVGFPINALVNWPMATPSGDQVFQNSGFNARMKAVLDAWSDMLQLPASANVLDPAFTHDAPPAIGWLNPEALAQVNKVALSASGQALRPGQYGTGTQHPDPVKQFQQIFHVTDPGAPLMGFTSWDDFFTREFNADLRPTPDAPPPGAILNACESGPLQYITGAALHGTFEAKNQQYSLSNIFGARQDLAEHFEGGSIYQAFLSALSYHRWHAPVSGTLAEAYVIDGKNTDGLHGTYYWENPFEGYKAAPGEADPSAPNYSQPFLSAVAARAVMVIETETLGKVGIVTIGMAEVGSNEITAELNKPIAAGAQLGMFHFGGSTHCLIFEKGVTVTFSENVKVTDKPNYESGNVAVRSLLATARRG